MLSDLKSDSRHWQLFGLDLSRTGRYLRAGWQELLQGEVAGIRKRVDLPVLLHLTDGSRRCYVAEQLQSSESLPHNPELVHAVQLPAEKVLLRRLRLPQVLEMELQEAVALEVRTHSPFAAENTVYGWRIMARSENQLELSLAIAARSDVLAWLATPALAALRAPEVWVLDAGGSAIVLRGFGERPRQRAYSRRLGVVAMRLAFILACLVALLALPGMVRGLQAERMSAYLDEAQAEAGEAQALRESLLLANTRVMEFQAMLDRSVNHSATLERISRLTPDDVFVQSYTLEGPQLRLVGQAVNAAAYMQLLTEEQGFAEVQTPAAFNRDNRTGLERFVFDIRLAAQSGEVSP